MAPNYLRVVKSEERLLIEAERHEEALRGEPLTVEEQVEKGRAIALANESWARSTSYDDENRVLTFREKTLFRCIYFISTAPIRNEVEQEAQREAFIRPRSCLASELHQMIYDVRKSHFDIEEELVKEVLHGMRLGIESATEDAKKERWDAEFEDSGEDLTEEEDCIFEECQDMVLAYLTISLHLVRCFCKELSPEHNLHAMRDKLEKEYAIWQWYDSVRIIVLTGDMKKAEEMH
ncbi:hypothetical protein KEM55_005142 [Ascosphaera atra]|nr:hypothetical protein KEM55_005142 [Ascosphaera atra]